MILILSYSICFCQAENVNSDNSYPTAKQDLKEFLAIQTLLAENRIEDLKRFLIEYNYSNLPNNDDDDLLFIKSDLMLNHKDNIYYPVIVIKSYTNESASEKTKDDYHFAENYLLVTYFKYNKGEKIFRLSRIDVDTIRNVLFKAFSIGYNYKMFLQIKEADNSKFNGTIENIDKYTLIVRPKENKEKIYRASNFTVFPEPEKSTYDSEISFFGPGKLRWIDFGFRLLEIEQDYSLQLSTKAILKFNDPNKNPFDYEYFMSLENFDDKIWLDKN